MRIMKLSSILMMGLAFTAGLVLGLLAHLPKVSSPLETSAGLGVITSEGGRRLLRSVPDDDGGDDRPLMTVTDTGIHQAGDSWTNGSRVYKPQVNTSAIVNSDGQDNPPVGQPDVVGQTLSGLQAAIESTSNSINALKQDSIFTKTDANTPDSELASKHSAERTEGRVLSKTRVRVETPKKNVQVRVSRTKKGYSGKVVVLNGGEDYGQKDKSEKVGPSHDDVAVSVGDPSQHTEQTDTDETLIPADPHTKPTFIRQQTSQHLHTPFHHVTDIISGCYWRPEIDMLTPPGFTQTDITKWRSVIDNNHVASMETGCGRMQNRLLTLKDSSRICARYRINTDQIQGEIYSYYLARVLGINNIPPSVLARPDPTDIRWSSVRSPIISAEWSSQKVVVMTPWQDGLEAAYIPREMRGVGDGPNGESTTLGLHPSDELLVNRSLSDLAELVQWSDLIVFDYLTANVDRVVNNLFNRQWNSVMMHSPAHNLEKSTENNLIFLDNESGLFHSYRLLDKYSHYHRSLLDNLCIYRKSTADVIKRLHNEQNAGKEVMDLFKQHEPLHKSIPRIPDKNMKTLQDRIADVYQHIVNCEQLYPV